MENSIDSFKKDIDKYSAIWEKALRDGIFDSADNSTHKNDGTPVDEPSDFFGLQKDVFDIPLNESEGANWNKIYRASVNEVIKEEKKEKIQDLVKNSKSIANAFNPIHIDTTGKDTKNINDGGFSSGQDLEELEKMKKKLHELKVKMTSKEIKEDKRFPSLKNKIQKLEAEIDELSDSLSGTRMVPKQMKTPSK